MAILRRHPAGGRENLIFAWVLGGFLIFPALICRSILDNKKCSAGWKIFEKSCYSFSTEMMSWADAKESCADQGAHLVIVNSELEQVRRTLAREK